MDDGDDEDNPDDGSDENDEEYEDDEELHVSIEAVAADRAVSGKLGHSIETVVTIGGAEGLARHLVNGRCQTGWIEQTF